MEVLKQGVNSPLPVEEQIAMIYAGTENLMRKVPINKVKEFLRDYVDFLKAKHADTLAALKAGKYDNNLTSVLKQVADDIAAKYN